MIQKPALRRILIGAALLLTCQSSPAQQLQATRSHFSTEDGLCSNAIANIYQDDYGYIWIASWNGLSRFDGFEFYNYKTGNGSRIKNLHNRILDMVIDQSQNVWMHMYDGRVFVLNRQTDQIINPFENYPGNEEFRTTSPLLVTSTGEVLISIEGNGLYIMTLDRRGLKSEQVTTGELRITSVSEGYQSDIWFGTNKGIHRLDRSNLALENKSILPEEEIACLYSNGFNIFAATNKGAIYSFAYGQEPKLLRQPSGNAIINLFVDSHGLIWFCDKEMGAYRLNPETGNEKFQQQKVLAPIYESRGGNFNENNGTVWVRMNHGGYGYYNREADVVEYFHNDPSNPWNLSNTVNASLELPEGVVWESTSRRGLEKLEILKNNIVRVRPVANATSTMENEIRAMYYDSQRRLLLLGNKSSSLFLIGDNGTQTVITHDSQGKSLGRLYGISKDTKGNYWLSSKDYGLFKMSPNGSGWTIQNFCHQADDKQSLSNNGAYLTVEDKHGNIWVATYGGGVNLMTEQGGKTVFLHPQNGMKDYPKNAYMKVRTIEADNEGNIWAGTTDGILILSYKDKQLKLEKLKMPEESDKILMSNDVVCLRRDAKGTMWVGTNGGGIGYTIGKDQNGTWLFDTFDSKDGLPSEEIRSITFDQRGNAWFATEHVICSFDVSKKIFTTFSSLDGVDETNMSEGGAITTGNGNILFGTLDGYYVVDRKKLMTSTGSLLKLNITDFFIDDELQSPRLNDNYDFYVPVSKVVTLPGRNESFAFRFAALNYQLQHRVHYQYMLEGYDREWQNAGKDRMAYYSDVPAGTYTFKVKAFLLESPEKYDLRTIEVVVPSSFLLSPTALWLYLVILLLAILALLYKFKNKLFRKKHVAIDENPIVSPTEEIKTDEYEVIE
ncbi:MAG: hypothetical protein IJ067_07565 [Prevotella sp.]|nr:hypothetical protein [Prevotella sp.]